MDLFSDFGALFLLSFFLFLLVFKFFIFNNFFNFYFNKFISFFFLFFFHFFSLFFGAVWLMWFSCWPGVRSVHLMWESHNQDIGPPENSQLHITSNSKSSPRNLHLNAKTHLRSTTSKLQCWTLYAKQLARQEHNPTH